MSRVVACLMLDMMTRGEIFYEGRDGLIVFLLNYFEVSWQGLQLGYTQHYTHTWYDWENYIEGAKHFHSGLESVD
jgi:hypothetical protein